MNNKTDDPSFKTYAFVAKGRFLRDPSSPEYLGWDNPFPTFPSSKKRYKHPVIEGLNNSMNDVKLDQRSYAELPEESRLSEGGGNSRHNFLHNGGSSDLQDGVSTKTNPRTAHSPYTSQQDTNQIIHGADLSSQFIESSRTQPIQPSSHLGPQMEYSRHLEGTPRDPSFRPPAPSRSNNQRSQTMPAALTDALTNPGSRGNYEQRTIAQDDRPHPLVPRDWSHLESPLHHQSSRPPLQPHSRSADILPHGGRMSHELQTLHPHSFHSQQASVGEVFDLYYHSPHHSRSSSEYADSQRVFLDKAMPNFEPIAEAGAGATHKRGLTSDDHLHSQQSAPALPFLPADFYSDRSSRPVSLSRSAKGFFRTGSSPNLQHSVTQRSHGSQQYSDGFDFELPGSIPAMYSVSPQTSRKVHPSTTHHENRSQRGYKEQQQHTMKQPSQPSVNQQELNNKPSTGGLRGKIPQYPSPDTPSRSPASRAFPNHDSSGSPRIGPSPINRVKPGSLPINQLSHPDALPVHPAPIRAGLMGPAPSKQPLRPRPVRQDTGGSVRHNEKPSNPQPQISRAPREEKQPSAVTQEGLERLRQASKSNPSDRKTQLLLAKKLVEAASGLTDEDSRADSKTTNRNCERFTSEAYKIVKRLAQHGYPDATFFLGDCYTRGSLGLQTDAKEAFAQYQSAAKAEHAQAAYRVAVCCEIGLDEGGGTKRDAVKAMQWYQRAAILGDTPAMYKLGVIQLKGLLGQPRNAKAALTWLQQAAARGDKENPHALHELVSDGYLRMKRLFD